MKKINNKRCIIISIVLILVSLPLVMGFLVDFLVEKEIEALKKELKVKQMEFYRVPYRKDTQTTLYEENAYKYYLRGIEMMDSYPDSVQKYIEFGVRSRYISIYDTDRLPGRYPFSGAKVVEMASFSIERSKNLAPEKRMNMLMNVLNMARDVNNWARTYDGCLTGIIVSTYAVNEMKKITPILSVNDVIKMENQMKSIEISWYPPESSMFQELVHGGIKDFETANKSILWFLGKYLVPERLFSRKFGKLRKYRAKEQQFTGYSSGNLFSEREYDKLIDYPGARSVIAGYYELRAHFAQVYTAIDVLNYYRNYKELPGRAYFDTLQDKNLYKDPFTGKYADYYVIGDTLFISIKNRGHVNTLAYPVD